MPATAIIGSIFQGTCPCHKSPRSVSGIVVTGSPDHTIEGMPVGRVNDIVIASCSHSAIIISGKPTNFTNGLMKGQVTSIAVGCPTGIIITGAATAS